jgi:hypothetical protein
MLSFEEHQILFHLGEYSSETSSLQYGGLNPDWAQPPYSEPLARRPLNPPANPFKPLSAAPTTRPSDLDSQALVYDNAPPRLHPVKYNSHGFQPPSPRPPKQNLPETSDDSDISDSLPPSEANTIPETQVGPPTIEVKDRDDEDLSDEEAAAIAERHFTLSSPMKQIPSSDVSCLPSLIEISDDYDIQDDFIMDEPPKAAARIKKQWQMSDLPRGMNDNEAWCKMLIPTVYWHFGNQRDVWMYDDDQLASDLGTIISAVYPSSLRQWVTVDGPVFRIVSILFFCIMRADDCL